MISIIICSRSAAALALVEANVSLTIGVPYEIIAIDNSQGQYGICQAYNIGANQSRYDILCFMHEDLKFHAEDWGLTVVKLLADQTIGVLGVAGGTYQPKVPSAYWSPGPAYIRMQIMHSAGDANTALDLVNPHNQQLAEVAVADGVWLCSRRGVWQRYRFDEQKFPAFHFYDIDYCTAVAEHYRICVTFNIVIEHYSKGSVNEQWLLAALDYQQKWARQLPFGPALLAQADAQAIEKRALTEFVTRLLASSLPNKLIWQQLRRLLNYRLDRETLGLLRRFIGHRLLSQFTRS